MAGLLLSGSAWAEGDVLGQAIRLYDAHQQGAALPLFEVVVQDASEPAQVRALAGIYLGLSKAQTGDRSGAQKALVSAFQLSPDMPLPAGTPADLAALAEQSRTIAHAQSAPERTGVAPADKAPAKTSAPVETPMPAKAAYPHQGLILGMGTRYFGIPIPKDPHGGPALELLIGKYQDYTRTSGVFGVLFGTRNAYELGVRMDIASHPRPLSFGAGFDFNLVYAPSEPISSALLFEGLINVFNIGWQWKTLLVELRTFSIGTIFRVSPDSPLFGLELGTGLSVTWMPATH